MKTHKQTPTVNVEVTPEVRSAIKLLMRVASSDKEAMKIALDFGSDFLDKTMLEHAYTSLDNALSTVANALLQAHIEAGLMNNIKSKRVSAARATCDELLHRVMKP